MNVFCYWYPNPNNKGLELLLKKIKANHVTYMYSNPKDSVLDVDIESTGIYTDEDPYKLLTNKEKKIPVDGDILYSMNKHMFSHLDIIHRWRSTLGTGDSYSKMKQFYFDLMQHWNDYIVSSKINLAIFTDIPHSADEYMIYSLCKAHDIPTIICQMLPVIEGELPNMYFTTEFSLVHKDFYDRYKHNQKYYENILLEDINLSQNLKIYLTNYSTKNLNVGTVVATESSESLFKVGLKRTGIYLRQKRYRILFKKAIKYLTLRNKSKLLEYLESLEQENAYNEKYIYFPLHLQPESSTSPNSQLFSRQEIAIQMISSCLPKGVMLYVKEHPAYWMSAERYDFINDSRSKDYYDFINKLPNVRIINHNASTTKLIDGAIALATINGSAGWEAMIREKPIIMFGNSFYKHMDEVYKIKNSNDCKKALYEIINEGKGKVSIKTIAVYLKTFEELSVTASTDYEFIKRTGCKTLSKEDNDTNMAKGMYNFINIAYPELL